MKTTNQSISEILTQNSTSFFIPPFQRAYAWGKSEIERYFRDMMRIIKSELDPRQHDKEEHFFGTLVISKEEEGFASKSVVIDGQQRLTTTLLFLIALRDLEPDEKNQDYITQNYLTNNTSTFEDKIKLKQVTKDWDSYRALVNKEEAKPGIIQNAYHLFTKLVSETKRSHPQIRFEHYIKAIMRMNVAVIFLDERPFKGEDPQIIFETLNSLGKPLTLSDLVRNFVLLKMNSSNQSDIYEKIWHPKIEAVLNDDASRFFRDYLQYKTASSIKVVSDSNTKEVYQQFTGFVEERFDTHKDFIDDIVRYVQWYKWIVTEVVTDTISRDAHNDKVIIELTRNIFHDIQTEAFKPFVLGLFEYHQDRRMDDETLIAILKVIRTYLIRRRILGLGQGENKNIVLLVGHIKDLATGAASIFDVLSGMLYWMRFPNDNEMKTALLAKNFYDELKKYSKFILGKIEEHNAKVAVNFRDPKITIEHIMPQKLNGCWELELGDDYARIHKAYLHNIGNLILTEFNSEIGNKPFAEKKQHLNESSLHFRLDVINKETWNEASLQTHHANMIEWFLSTFPLPDTYKDRDNWKVSQELLERTRLSPLDDDAGDFAEGNKPTEILINGGARKVFSWPQVLFRFLLHIYKSQDLDFEFVYNNQAQLFNKEDVIIKWSDVKRRIEENPDWKGRYRTLNGGKTWDKAENITDGDYLIHVNISASACMRRIANVMNRFNMPNNYVEVVLSSSSPRKKTQADSSLLMVSGV